jgi:hypothetical protein
MTEQMMANSIFNNANFFPSRLVSQPGLQIDPVAFAAQIKAMQANSIESREYSVKQ